MGSGAILWACGSSIAWIPGRWFLANSQWPGSSCEDSLRPHIIRLYVPCRPAWAGPLPPCGPQHFYAFGLLWLNGRDHRGLPLVDRKQRLREIAPAASSLLHEDQTEAQQ